MHERDEADGRRQAAHKDGDGEGGHNAEDREDGEPVQTIKVQIVVDMTTVYVYLHGGQRDDCPGRAEERPAEGGEPGAPTLSPVFNRIEKGAAAAVEVVHVVVGMVRGQHLAGGSFLFGEVPVSSRLASFVE